MNTYSEKEIKEVNKLLHKMLGASYIDFNVNDKHFRWAGADIIKKNDNSDIKNISEGCTLEFLKEMSDKNYLLLYRFLHFYHPRWIAYNVIKDSGIDDAEFSSNNELMLALTSIIDSISNDVVVSEIAVVSERTEKFYKNNKKRNIGYTKKFKLFLNEYLKEEDVEKIFKDSKVIIKRKKKNIKNIEDFAKYVYKIRSLVVHEAELGGIYPYSIEFDFNKETINNVIFMLRPEEFRRLLWKAILNYLGLKIIY